MIRTRIGWLAVAGVLLCVPSAARAEPAKEVEVEVTVRQSTDLINDLTEQTKREQEFARTMSGATLVGSFTLTGAEDKKLTEEKYTISKVKKIKDDLWQFESRIQYSGHDVTLPLALHVKWAGDTPVITLTDLPVPGLGTFTARVLVFRGEYAGTWSGGDHGGHLFGRIVPKDAADGEKPTDRKSDSGAPAK